MTGAPTYIDGNALAGPLTELFAADITAAATTCPGCGHEHRIAQLHVYSSGHGLIARCPTCDHLLLRYVRRPTSAVLEMGGVIRVPVVTATTTT